jgi:hypothetical protein
MKTVFRILILISLCTLASCSEKQTNPLQDALGTYILQGQEGSFLLYDIAKIDSTTFRTEFERRQNVYELKLQEETKLYDDYNWQRKPKNAARHWEAIQRTRKIMKGLDSLKTIMEGRMDEIAYYDYVFSGRAETGDKFTDFKDAYVSMTPTLQVISMTAQKKDLHKAGGRAIPGYLQMLGDTSEED